MTPDIMLFCLALTGVAILTKLIGCGIPARLARMSRQDSLVVGIGMVPPGEIAMVIALMALDAGIIAQPAYVTLVLMSLLTTIVVPLVLRNFICRDIATGPGSIAGN